MIDREAEHAPPREAIEALARSASAAFAIDDEDRIVYWNAGAERLLGWSAAEALGRRCYETLSGLDAFGNRYCGRLCPILSAATAGAATRPFCMELRGRGGTRHKVRIRTAGVPSAAGPRLGALVHLLDEEREGGLDDVFRQSRASVRPEPPPGPRRVRSGVPEVAPHPLTAREREVLILVAQGYGAQGVAAQLGISHATVRNHVQHILRKLGVHGQVEAVAMSLRMGLI